MLAILFCSTGTYAADTSFSGSWSFDLRTAAERQRGAECGLATVVLKQTGNRITGNHSMATVDCGRINDGGEGTVKGVVVGATAVLVVTSTRNGGMAMGTAKLELGSLRWEMLEEVRPSDTEGDSPLIFWRGLLSRDASTASSAK